MRNRLKGPLLLLASMTLALPLKADTGTNPQDYRGSLGGRVLMSSVPAPGVTVEAIRVADAPLERGEELIDLLPLRECPKAGPKTTDASGAFRFDNLPIGQYVLIAATDTAVAHCEIKLLQLSPTDDPGSFEHKNIEERTHIVLELRPAEAFRGRVVAPNGQPASGAEICPHKRKLDGRSLSFTEAYVFGQKCGNDGAFSFPKLEKGPWQFDVSLEGKTPILTDWFSTGSPNVEIRLQEPPPAAPPRYSVSPEGVIRDSRTGLEWLPGPDRDTKYSEAEAWARSCTVAGGGWRMPMVGEVVELCEQNVEPRTIYRVFKFKGNSVWGHSYIPSVGWRCTINYYGQLVPRTESATNRGFAVRGPVRLKHSGLKPLPLILAVNLGVFLVLRFRLRHVEWPIHYLPRAVGIVAILMVFAGLASAFSAVGVLSNLLFTLLSGVYGAALWNRTGWRTIPALAMTPCLAFCFPGMLGAALSIVYPGYYIVFCGPLATAALCASLISLILLLAHAFKQTSASEEGGR